MLITLKDDIDGQCNVHDEGDGSNKEGRVTHRNDADDRVFRSSIKGSQFGRVDIPRTLK